MNKVPIREAQRICEAIHARGVIVLAFTPVMFSCVSYGATMRECKKMADLLDRIVTMLADGTLKPWGSGPGGEK